MDKRESLVLDGLQAEDGRLVIVGDHRRDTLNRAGNRGVASVQIAESGEEDIHAGKPVTVKVRPYKVVTKLQDTTIRREHQGNEDPTDNCGCRTVELPINETAQSLPDQADA